MCQAHAFHKPMRQRAVCAKRLADGLADGVPWVRARGRALQNCVRTIQGPSECFSKSERFSGRGGLRAERMLFHWRGAFGDGWPAGKASAFSIAWSLRGLSPAAGAGRPPYLQWHCPEDPLPRRPLANGGAMGLHTFRVQTVLQCAPPCAPQRHRQRSANGQAYRKNLSAWQKARKRPCLPA